MSSFSKQSRFMRSRSMTPSGSVNMSTSRFNLVCGKTTEQACRPNLDRIPNPQPPKIIDARVTTPTMSRREFSQTRETYGRTPVPPTRGSSLYLPFGTYAEIGVHTKAPDRYSSSSHSSGYNMRTSRRSVTPGPSISSYTSQVSSIPSSSYSSSRRNSVSLSSSNAYSSSSSSTSRQRQYSFSAANGTPSSARGLSFY